MESRDPRIASRSWLSPPMNLRNWMIRSDSSASRSPIVVSVWFRFEIRSPTSRSRDGQCVGHRRGAAQQALERAALALEDLDQLVGELVDVLGGHRGEQRLEAVEQHRQVERRLRPLSGIVAPSCSTSGPPDALGERDVALSDEVAVADRGVGALGELRRRSRPRTAPAPRCGRTISTPLTLPTFTPATRMSSPFTTPVASENTAL